MSVLLNATNATSRTENGALQYHTTGSACLDFFSKVSSCREDTDVAKYLFNSALAEDPELAMRILLWAHDIRGGAGERQVFRDLTIEFLNDPTWTTRTKCDLLSKIPELGRWDTPFLCAKAAKQKILFVHVLQMATQALYAENALCAKWIPRRGEIFNRLCGYLGITPKQLRKLLKKVTGITVERLMSENRWSEINYEHVPSVAMSRYRNAFLRHDGERFREYLNRVENGESKINTSVVFPHDVIRNCETNPAAAQAQWDNLPNYADTRDNILCMADVSGSMCDRVSGCITAMDIAIGLAIYIAERNHGIFKDEAIIFSAEPLMVKLQGNVTQKMRQLKNAMDPFNTDFMAALRLILRAAVKNKIPAAEMPTKLLVLSDMQFDYSHNMTIYREIEARYHRAGYRVPEIVFWNLSARYTDGQMVTRDTKGTCSISGYSPAILKEVLKGSIPNPYTIMLNTVGDPKYALPVHTHIRGVDTTSAH